MRQLLANLLLTLSTAGVYIALRQYTVTHELTPHPDADTASLTAEVLSILVICLGGLAAMINVVAIMLSAREDAARRRQEADYEEERQKRGWLEIFLDPRFLNTPENIKERQKFFRSIVNPSFVWKWGLLAPSLALFVMLLVRLFDGAPVFLGDPASLDFGWKYGIDEGDEAEKSMSFTPEATSWGHAIQGVLSSLLATPVIMQGMFHLTRGRAKWLFQLAPFALTIYPAYNLIKRFVKSSDVFAGSSFANNGFEWAVGFMVGLAMGQVVTSIRICAFLFCGRRVGVCASPVEEVDEEVQPEKVDESEANNEDESEERLEIFETSFFIKMMQRFFGLLLVFTLYAAGVLYGLTWYACPEEFPECVNLSEDADEGDVPIAVEVMCVMTIVPTVVMLAGMIL